MTLGRAPETIIFQTKTSHQEDLLSGCQGQGPLVIHEDYSEPLFFPGF